MDGGGLLSPIMPSGPAYARYFRTIDSPYPAGSAASAVVGRVYLAPLQVFWAVSINGIIYSVGTTSAGNVRVGIYRQGATLDSPAGGKLVVESASDAQPGVTRLHSLAIAATILGPGLYFLALQWSDATGTFIRSSDSAALLGWYYSLGAYGAFTDPCPAVAGSGAVPSGLVRVATNLGL